MFVGGKPNWSSHIHGQAHYKILNLDGSFETIKSYLALIHRLRITFLHSSPKLPVLHRKDEMSIVNVRGSLRLQGGRDEKTAIEAISYSKVHSAGH